MSQFHSLFSKQEPFCDAVTKMKVRTAPPRVQKPAKRKNNDKYTVRVTHPRGIGIEHINSSTVIARWKEPENVPVSLCGKLHYKVRISGDGGKTFPMSFVTPTRVCEVTSLEPNHNYQLMVLSVVLGEAAVIPKKHAAVHFITRPLPQHGCTLARDPESRCANEFPQVGPGRYGKEKDGFFGSI